MNDARTRYTKMVIRNAFLQLLRKYSIEKISVTEICRLAEINRATFYRYYENQKYHCTHTKEIDNAIHSL